jgi:ribosome maturation factor RimP
LNTQGDRSPLFYYWFLEMIAKDRIRKLVEEHTEGTALFVVDVKVSSANKITILVDTHNGITIDECISVSRHVEQNLDREKEDFELMVSSPGLEMPFLVLEQYVKNEGKKVVVLDNEGGKYQGVLKNVTVGGFEVEVEVKKKGENPTLKEISFNYGQVKATKTLIDFK